jgi:hypothetical protein
LRSEKAVLVQGGGLLHLAFGNSPLHSGNTKRRRHFRRRLLLTHLYQFYVVRCRTFLTLLDVEADALTFLQRLEAAGLNGTVMNEQITTVIFFDEPEAFLVIEPLYFTF